MLVCEKCANTKVTVSVVEKIKTKRRGLLGWLMWAIIILCTCGIAIIIPLLTNKTIGSKTNKIAVCQCCGHSWNVKE
jgi:hypothetical protein